MENLPGMNRNELLELRSDVDQRLSEFKRLRLRLKHTRCGKKDCFCKDGPGNGEWGNLHGPYIIAQFVDHKTSKTRSVSLGIHYDFDRQEDLKLQTVGRTHFAHLPASKHKNMSASDQNKYVWSVWLSADEFYMQYSMTVAEDTMNRSRIFYGTQADQDAYDTECRLLEADQAALDNDLCKDHGIGTVKGQQKLTELLDNSYYLVVD